MLGLLEALGVNELSSAVEALRVAVEASVKGGGGNGNSSTVPRSRAELQQAHSRLEKEVAQLRQQLQDSDVRKSEIIAQLKEEVRS